MTLKEGRVIYVHAEESELNLGYVNSRQKHPMFLCCNFSGGYRCISWSHPENYCDCCMIKQPKKADGRLRAALQGAVNPKQ